MLSQRDPPLSESATPRTAILRLASSNHPVTASRNPPVGDETEGRRYSGYKYSVVVLVLSVTLNNSCGTTPLKDRSDSSNHVRSNVVCVSSRLERIPYYFSANANADGRCHESSCWLLGFGQQPAS